MPPLQIPSDYEAARAQAEASGLASNAFGIRDNQGVIPLSLPPEGSWDSWAALREAACKHAELARYCLVKGRGARRRKDKGNRWTKFLSCKHSRPYDSRNMNKAYRQRDRKSKKTECIVRMKVQERPDGSWTLRYLPEPLTRLHNHEVNDPSPYHEHRKLNDDQKRLVDTNYSARISAARTKKALKANDPGSLIISRDI